MLYRDRRQAGRELGERLEAYRGRPDVVVLALPRGGVPVAYEVARALGAPLDIFLVRKLGVPGQPELAMGAIASGGVRVMNPEIVAALRISSMAIARVTRNEEHELALREARYRQGQPALDVRGKVAILVDDGLATGATVRAAAEALRTRVPVPARIVAAAPVGAGEACDELRALVDEVVCARMPEPFVAVGAHYGDFDQTSDEEVHRFLELARLPRRPKGVVGGGAPVNRGGSANL